MFPAYAKPLPAPPRCGFKTAHDKAEWADYYQLSLELNASVVKLPTGADVSLVRTVPTPLSADLAYKLEWFAYYDRALHQNHMTIELPDGSWKFAIFTDRPHLLGAAVTLVIAVVFFAFGRWLGRRKP